MKEELIEIFTKNKEEIRKILGIDVLESQNEMFELLKKMINLLDEKSKLEKENYLLKKDNEELKEENKNFKKRFAEIEDILENSPFFKTYSNLEDVYCSLSKETKFELKKLLDYEDFFDVYSGAVVYIEAIWDYALKLRKEYKLEEFDKMKELFELLFDNIAKFSDYKLQDVKKGDKFNNEYLIIDEESDKTDGIVTEVVLRGFYENEKLIRKSVVKIN